VFLEFQVQTVLPAQPTGIGSIVEKIGESQHILPHAVAQKFETSSSGALIPATEGSIKPVTVTQQRVMERRVGCMAAAAVVVVVVGFLVRQWVLAGLAVRALS
jgi:hypothetical protein